MFISGHRAKPDDITRYCILFTDVIKILEYQSQLQESYELPNDDTNEIQSYNKTFESDNYLYQGKLITMNELKKENIISGTSSSKASVFHFVVEVLELITDSVRGPLTALVTDYSENFIFGQCHDFTTKYNAPFTNLAYPISIWKEEAKDFMKKYLKVGMIIMVSFAKFKMQTQKFKSGFGCNVEGIVYDNYPFPFILEIQNYDKPRLYYQDFLRRRKRYLQKNLNSLENTTDIYMTSVLPVVTEISNDIKYNTVRLPVEILSSNEIAGKRSVENGEYTNDEKTPSKKQRLLSNGDEESSAEEEEEDSESDSEEEENHLTKEPEEDSEHEYEKPKNKLINGEFSVYGASNNREIPNDENLLKKFHNFNNPNVLLVMKNQRLWVQGTIKGFEPSITQLNSWFTLMYD